MILPIVIAWILSNFELKEAWLGYWGGIIGSALGVLGAFLILKEQIKNDKASLEVQLESDRVQNKRQQIDNTFFNLLSMLFLMCFVMVALHNFSLITNSLIVVYSLMLLS